MKEYSRGFVTLATGHEKYYKAAANMLESYRYQNCKTRFGIICDRENEYTKHFDDVFVLKECNFDYRDKFELFKMCPYDRNFFIEPDCLIYNNIDFFWDVFEGATSVSAFGYNNAELSAWFDNPDIIVELFGIKSMPLFNPGYFYFEKTEHTKQFYRDLIIKSQRIMQEGRFQGDKKIYVKNKLRDDPVIWMAMSDFGFFCKDSHEKGGCVFLPSIKKIEKISLRKKELDVIYKSLVRFNNCNILHFSSRRMTEGCYKNQIVILKCLVNKKGCFLVPLLETKLVRIIFELFFKVINRITGIRK